MLLADPLSRVCAPTEGWFDPTLPAMLAALLAHMTVGVKNNEQIRIYCHQDTIASKDSTEMENSKEQDSHRKTHPGNKSWCISYRNTDG